MSAAPRNDSASGLLRIFIAATTWGSIPVFLALAKNVDSFVVVFWRVAITGATMLLIGAFTGDSRSVLALPRRHLGALALQGALLALNWVLFFSAMKLAGVAVGEMLGYIGPVFVAALTPLLLRERFDARVLLPLALALGGTVVILSATLGAGFGPNVGLGAALAAGSSLTYSLLILNAKRLLHGTSPVTLMIAEDVVATVLLLPAVFLLRGPSTRVEWLALVVLALVHTVFTGLVFMSGLQRVRADHAAVLTYAEPVSAVAFGALLLHQPVTPLIALGGAGVVAGGILVARMHTGFGQEAPPAEE